MALIKTNVKVTLFEKRPYAMTGADGEEYKGFSYKGFTDGDHVIRFSSPKEYPVKDEVDGYDPENVLELPKLYGKQFMTEPVKWSTEEPKEPKSKF